MLVPSSDISLLANDGKKSLFDLLAANDIAKMEEELAGGMKVTNETNDFGITLFMTASYDGNLPAVKLLLKYYDDPDFVSESGSTALTLACSKGHSEILEVLLDSSADMNRKNSLDMTPLMLAAESNHEVCVEILVRRGAEIFICDIRGRNALDVAVFYNHSNLLALLDTQKQVQYRQSYVGTKRNHVLTGLVKNLCRTNGSISPINQHIFEYKPHNKTKDLSLSSGALTDTSCRKIKHWSEIFLRSVNLLPADVCNLIFEYIPQPRVWQWSLSRLMIRCELNPHQAMLDISVIIDEILCDANIHSGPDQKQFLVKISESKQIQERLRNHYMTDTLLRVLIAWSGIQKRLMDSSILPKPNSKESVARGMLTVAALLLKWYNNYEDSLLGLETSQIFPDITRVLVKRKADSDVLCDFFGQISNNKNI